MRSAFRDAPATVIARRGRVVVLPARIGDVVDEQVHLPVFPDDADTYVADVVGGIGKLRVRCVLVAELELVNAVSGKRPLEADEQLVSTEPGRRLVILGPRPGSFARV